MTEEQYKDYTSMLIKEIESAAGPLDDDRYESLMTSITQLIDVAGDFWQQLFEDRIEEMEKSQDSLN